MFVRACVRACGGSATRVAGAIVAGGEATGSLCVLAAQQGRGEQDGAGRRTARAAFSPSAARAKRQRGRRPWAPWAGRGAEGEA